MVYQDSITDTDELHKHIMAEWDKRDEHVIGDAVRQ